jgi:hypothetical protein
LRLRIVLVCLAGAMMTSCAVFPTAQLSLDLSAQTMPIMLSAVETSAKTIPLSFESGHKRLSVTTTSSYGGATTSSTATVSSDLNKPINQQLSNVLIQEPDWLLVSGLVLKADVFYSVVVTSVNYVLDIELKAPAKK